MPALEPFAEQAFAVLNESLKSKILNAPFPGLGDGPLYGELAVMLDGFARNRQDSILSSVGDVNANRVDEWISGLWLLAGDIDRSHTLSQDIQNREGSFLHAIMHRREGDFSNAKYWFNRVGKHAVLDQIQELTAGQYRSGSDFVDLVAKAVRAPNNTKEDLEKIQWIEWQALLVHCL
jgi:hypothetical protein